MIVLNNKEVTPEHKTQQYEKESYESMFRKELDAYCTYKEWAEETEDAILEMALEEIMLDEYLHAKFLRDYMIDHDMYSLHDDDPHEKKFWKIQKHMFQD
jgi:rubrerythrin